MADHSRPPRTAILAGVIVIAIGALAAGLILFRPRDAAPLVIGPPPSFAPVPAGAAVLVGAGDIASCASDADAATATLVDAIPGTVFVAGDNAYDDGSQREYATCYGPTWGRHLGRTGFPSPGNHEYRTLGAAGYLDYFGLAARPRGTTWYSAELGGWHIVVLDSECQAIGGCGRGSAQFDWLAADLAASDAACTLAIWHRPRFSSGQHGNDASLDDIWRALHDAGAEVVINGHDHDYERFAPQTPDAAADPAAGIRQFVVGTGGGILRDFGRLQPNSEVRDAATFGVLRLVLQPGGYSWSFVPVGVAAFTDAGSGRCH